MRENRSAMTADSAARDPSSRAAARGPEGSASAHRSSKRPEKPLSPLSGGPPRTRLETLDLIRGLTLVSMILYHGMWDFLYLSETGASMSALRTWYEGIGGHLWQQSICRTFILLSGFCVPFSRNIFRRGLQVSAGGLAVSAVTLLLMYEERVLFGVLTFLGAAMLLTGAVEKIRGRHAERSCGDHAAGKSRGNQAGEQISGNRSAEDRPPAGTAVVGLLPLAACLALFHMTRWVNLGFVRFGPWIVVSLPEALYGSGSLQESPAGKAAGLVLTGMGFPMKGFFSTDYFSLIPWIFLFLAGVCLNRLLLNDETAGHPPYRVKLPVLNDETAGHPLYHVKLPVLNDLGRHSLLIYLLHQPILYLLVLLIF